MALKDSIKTFGRIIGVLPQEPPPVYDQQMYPMEDEAYYGDGYGNAPYGNDAYGQNPQNAQWDVPPQQQRGAGGQRAYPQGDPYAAAPPPRPQPAPQAQQRYRATDAQPVSFFQNNQRSKHPPDNVLQMPRQEDVVQQRVKHSEIIICVRSMEDCQEIINALLEHKSVFINLETMDNRELQRVIDMLGGASFALRGTMAKISHCVYLLAPNTVDVINNQAAPAAAFRGEFSALRR